MAAWEGKSKGTTWGYRFFVGILKNFGVQPAYLLLRFVALYYWLFSWRSAAAIFNYFHHRLGYGRLRSALKIYRNFYLLGQTIIDKVVVMSGIRNPFTFDFDGEINLRRIVELNRGGLLLSSHIGNWEIAGHLLRRLGTRINIVMYDGEHRQIKEYLNEVTGKRNVHVIVLKNDHSHIYEISEALRNNELVCMHADRFVEGVKTISAPFLGEPARFPMGPFVLAATFRVPVSYVFAMKESSWHYHFFASAVHEYGHLNKKETINEMVSDFTAEMENKVKAYPEQWFNYYDFWEKP